jgi:hypothetical protein
MDFQLGGKMGQIRGGEIRSPSETNRATYEDHISSKTSPGEYYRGWLSTFDQSDRPFRGPQLELNSAETSPDLRPNFAYHEKRQSVSSSGIVHTTKTASLTDTSFKFAIRSLRIGQSTDSSGVNLRVSIDGERRPTSASMDEAALRRAIKRRQTLVELITTEEGYVADLKALIYLYSTLLATSVTVSSQVRSSVLRNCHDLLLIHERLLEQLHQVSYAAAARKWADTTSPQHLGSPVYHRRWKSLDSTSAGNLGRGRRRARSSLESSEAGRARTYLGGAEPRDVTDVAAIFRGFLNDFLAYEEYCANHTLIAHELQRYAPTNWSTYETGMESLARSLIALDQKRQNEKKGMTVGDLLIKPIQRMTKYPLLFDDLLKHTPVADCPSAQSELQATLVCLREVVDTVNQATDNRDTRNQIQRRWLLQSKLIYDRVTLRAEQFRMLGNVQLCGVLHVTWQGRNNKVDGRYALCVLFDNSLIIALPAGATAKFEIMAFLHLADISVVSASDGRALQCQSAHYTWKVCFEISGHLHEMIFSACSATEEHAWKGGMKTTELPVHKTDELFSQIPSSTSLDLRSIGQVYSQQSSTFSRDPTIQRAATVGNRANVCQVIIRNTNNPQDLGDFRQPSAAAVNRSQSHMTSNRVIILAPKRSERARLEATLGDVWTKERLPYPGMIGSRGGQIIRASAGSLVRKLSLASIHAPFSRRSGSLSLHSRKSFDASIDSKRMKKESPPMFEVLRDSSEEPRPAAKTKPREIPEVDTMDTVVARMIGGGSKPTFIPVEQQGGHVHWGGSMLQEYVDEQRHKLAPEDPVDVFYSNSTDISTIKRGVIENGLGGKRSRWGNSLNALKALSGDGLRHILYSSK